MYTSNRSLRIAFWVLMLALTGFAGIVSWILFFIPPPATFYRVQMLTPVVYPTGNAVAARTGGSVKIKAWVESPLDPACLVSTQYFMEFSDGSMAKLPGLRMTTRGEVRQSIYEASVPLASPLGGTNFFVRDTYNCGIQARMVQSPRVSFTIGDGATLPQVAVDATLPTR